MDVSDYIIPLFLFVEILIILLLYRFVLRRWIIEHWEEKIQEDEGNWLIDILSPAINNITDTILDNAPDAILSTLKNEMLSNTGTMTRVSKANPDNEMEVGLEMAEHFLQELGLKKPGVIMTLRAGQGILNLYKNKVSNNATDEDVSHFPTGSELF
jgi:hypothetical protein